MNCPNKNLAPVNKITLRVNPADARSATSITNISGNNQNNKKQHMKKIANQIIKALAGIFRSKSNTTQSSPAPQDNPQKTETDEIEFCCHPRHGAFPPRRKFKATGISARGHEFVIFQCPIPGCGEFVARTKDQTTSDYRILFRGHHFNPHRESSPRPAFRPARAAHHAA